MNKLIPLLSFILLLSFSKTSKAQYSFAFWELGAREKLWVACHPFVAIKAKRISEVSVQLSDSIAKAKSFPNLQNGGEKDALRHGLWMALLAKHIGSKKTLKLGAAHERKNWKDFKAKKLKEGDASDFMASTMDAFNNYRATIIADSCQSACKDSTLVSFILQALYQGEFRIIKMDNQGNSLDENGKIIVKREWAGKWLNNRQLVPSNYLLEP